MLVLISISKNQTRIASNLWNLFWNQNQNQNFLRTEPKIGLLVPFMYENTIKFFNQNKNKKSAVGHDYECGMIFTCHLLISKNVHRA
jgi:hypothetical protein